MVFLWYFRFLLWYCRKLWGLGPAPVAFWESLVMVWSGWVLVGLSNGVLLFCFGAWLV